MDPFWGFFINTWNKVWDIVSIPMHFGNITVSLVDIILLSGIVGILMTTVHYIIYDD